MNRAEFLGAAKSQITHAVRYAGNGQKSQTFSFLVLAHKQLEKSREEKLADELKEFLKKISDRNDRQKLSEWKLIIEAFEKKLENKLTPAAVEEYA